MAFGTEVGTAIAKLQLDITDFQAGMATALGEVDGFGSKITSALQGVSTSLTEIGTSLTKKVTIPIATALGMATKKYSDFAGGLQEAGTIMGATTEEMEELKDTAYKVAKDSIFTTKDTAEAYKYMAMAGWDATQSTSALSAIMALAAISGEELGTVSDIVTDDLTAFGMSAEEASHFANVLAEVSMDTNTNVGLMGESFKYVGPIAGTLGYSIEDVSVAMGLMASSSIKGSTAGTGLRQALTSLINPSKEAAGLMVQLGLAVQEYENVVDENKVLRLQGALEKKTLDMEKAQIKYNDAVEKYGAESSQAAKAMIDIEKKTVDIEQAQLSLDLALRGTMEAGKRYNTLMFDSSGNSKSFLEVMQKLREVFKGLTDEQKTAYAETLFGQRAMGAMLTVLEATDEEFEQLTNSIYNARDAQEVANDMLDSLKGTFEKFKSSLDVFLTRLGEAFAPIIEKVVIYLTDLLDKLNAMSDEELRHIVNIALIVAAIGPVLTILGHLAGSIVNIIQLVSKISSLFSSFSTILSGAFGGVVAVISGVIIAVKAFFDMWEKGWNVLKTILEALGLALAAVGAIILGAPALIAGVVAAIVFAVSQAAILIHDNWVAIKEFFIDLWENIKESAINTWQSIQEAWGKAKEWFSNLWNEIKEDAKVIWDNIKELVQKAWDNIKETWENAKKWFSEFWEKVKEFAEKTWEAIKEKSIEIIEKLKDQWNNLKQWLSDLWAKIKETARDAWNNIKEIIVNIIENIREKIQEIKDWIAKKAEEIKEGIEKFKDSVVEKVTALFDKIKEKLEQFFDNLKQKLDEIKENIKSRVEEIKANIEEKVQNIIQMVKDRISELKENISQKLQEIKQAVSEKIQNIWDAIKEGIKNIISTIVDFFRETIEKIKASSEEIIGKVGDLFNSLIEKIKSLGGQMWEAGKGLFENLWNGLKDTWEGIKNWFQEKFDWVQGWIDKLKGGWSGITEAISNVVNGSHANGLDYVPFDGYVAELHKGERVLTKAENKEYSNGNTSKNGGGDTFNFYNTKPDPREYARQMKQAKKELLFD